MMTKCGVFEESRRRGGPPRDHLARLYSVRRVGLAGYPIVWAEPVLFSLCFFS